ncbi:hypothetical protein [Streptomyces viridosporus]|uniref:hypothetical protein n=1 Tax=Streptomyces viridosporus TaxID=67581 RepID=UPI0009BCC219|nr:hypothetical protein [Streptomyces viridosporus]
MMTTSTQRLLELSAAAPAADGEDLLDLLREGNVLYHQGLQETHQATATRLQGMSTTDLAAAADAAKVPYDATRDHAEMVLLLALAEWDMTPAALAYSAMVEDAARRGFSLLPEE